MRAAPRWSARRSPGSRGANSMPSVFTKRQYARPARNALTHNEALANELAARFYEARGFETIARAYLHNARHCYLRWGADGKVRQLEEMYPHLREEESVARADEHNRGAGRAARPCDGHQGVAGRLERDCGRKTDRHDHAHGDRAGGRRARLVDPGARGRTRIAAEATTSAKQ